MRPGPARRRPGEFGTGRKFTPRRKVCQFCVDKIKEVDYKDLVRLRRFLSERGKIEPRRKTGTCAAHQRSLNIALKRARQLALLPFTAEHIRVTGVLVREPGAPPFRGARPRPQELDGAPADGTPADGAVAVAAETPPDGQAAVADATPAPPTAADATPASSAVVAETAAAESAGEDPLPVTQGQQP
jgi:small subunit ribosomal protein S18